MCLVEELICTAIEIRGPRPSINRAPSHPKAHMYSLYDSLLAQHPRQLTPIRCALVHDCSTPSLLRRGSRGNSLGALVIESLSADR